MNDVNVLIVSDDSDNADILAHGLRQGRIQADAVGVEELTRKYIADVACDILIFDIYANATNLVSLCHEVSMMFDGPVLVMSYESDERFLLDLYNEGIAEYVRKPIGMPLFVAKVKVWLRRASVDVDLLGMFSDDFQIDVAQRILKTPEGDNPRLSKLEYQLFQLLYSNRGRVLPTNLLVERIWGQFEEGDGRLKHLVLRLRRKIEPNPSDPTYIETVDREGYRFRRVDRDNGDRDNGNRDNGNRDKS